MLLNVISGSGSEHYRDFVNLSPIIIIHNIQTIFIQFIFSTSSFGRLAT